MSLFPNEDIATKEIESWKGFADSLKSEEDRRLFLKMLNDCFKYAVAINTKGKPFPTEPLGNAYVADTGNFRIQVFGLTNKSSVIE
jgi:hypothetical protein